MERLREFRRSLDTQGNNNEHTRVLKEIVDILEMLFQSNRDTCSSEGDTTPEESSCSPEGNKLKLFMKLLKLLLKLVSGGERGRESPPPPVHIAETTGTRPVVGIGSGGSSGSTPSPTPVHLDYPAPTETLLTAGRS